MDFSILDELYTTLPIEDCKVYGKSMDSPLVDRSGVVPEGTHVHLRITQKNQIQKVLALANKHRISVVSRGAGSGKVGGAVPVQDAFVLDTSDLNACIAFEPENDMIHVEAGMITKTVKDLAESKGLFYPPDPASASFCSIGGNVACNSGGLSGIKYGVTGDYVMGIGGFWADGTPFQLGGKNHKDVAGYDLKKLIIGSEGTLAVITDVVLRLIPFPKETGMILFEFDHVQEALDALTKIKFEGVLPYAAELIDNAGVSSVPKLPQIDWPSRDDGVSLLVAIDGGSGSEIISAKDRIRSVVTQQGIEIDSKLVQNAIWGLRRDISIQLKKTFPDKVSHDVTVPPAQIAPLFDRLKKLEEMFNTRIIGYGHLGDGNMHVNILTPPESPDELRAIEEAIFKVAISLGGTITGEHGVGYTKKDYLKAQLSEKEMALSFGLKGLFDPNNILNPGKVF